MRAQLTVRQRLGTLALLFTITLAGFSAAVLSLLRQNDLERLELDGSRSQVEQLRASGAVLDQAVASASDLLATWDVEAARLKWKVAWDKLGQQVPQLTDILSRLRTANEIDLRSKVDALNSRASEYFAGAVKRMDAKKRGDLESESRALEEVQDLWQDLNRESSELRNLLGALGERSLQRLSDLSRAGADGTHRTLRAFWAGLGILLLLAAGMFFWIDRSLSVPIKKAMEVLERVAGRDLTCRLDVRSKDEIGRLGAALNEALGSLEEALQGIARQGDTLAEASRQLTEVSRSMDDNARQTSTQAGHVSGTGDRIVRGVASVAVSMKRVEAGIQDVGNNASQAAREASSAVDVLTATNRSVGQLLSASTEIQDITKTIAALAGQTNLLALNATIEAARAGEAGRGFGVVASEVKELARRSSSSAEDIGKRLGQIQAAATACAEAVGHAQEFIGRIRELQAGTEHSIRDQAGVIAEMTESVTRAAGDGKDVTRSMDAAVQAAQETAAGAAQTQTSASHLASIAKELRDLLGRFRYAAGSPVAGRTEKEPRFPA